MTQAWLEGLSGSSQQYLSSLKHDQPPDRSRKS